MSEPAAAKRILITTGVALVVGVVVVFGFVAPAEYGVDPLRTGRLLGLTALSDPGRENFALYEGEMHHDTYELEIAPFEGFEYKLDMEEGAGVVFEWTASGPLHIEMHSHPYDAPPDVAEFFDVSTGSERRGTYIAQFTGEHGW
ncbi:MAG: hypothetical protein PVI23_10715, partial [Maricaulaceae bacterium]